MTDMLQRLMRLEARADIENLMQTYALAADRKYTAAKAKKPQSEINAAATEQAACFAENAVWAGGKFGGDLMGRSAIEEFFRKSPWHFTAHHYGSAHIAVVNDQAHVTWRLLEIGIREADSRLVLMSGDVSQQLIHTNEGWRILHMRFTRLHAFALAEDPDALTCIIP